MGTTREERRIQMETTPEERYGLSRRRFLQLAGLTAGGLVLAACGTNGGGTETTAAPGTAAPTTGAPGTTGGGGTGVPKSSLSTINFDFQTPNITLQAPFWVAQSLGYFEEVGITTLNFTSSDDPVPPLIAGSLDVALLDSIVTFKAEQEAVRQGSPLGLTYTSCPLGAQPLVFVAREGITLDNLKGKTVGCARSGTVNEALCIYMLEQLGFDPQNDLNVVNLTGGSNDWVTALLTGQVDATIAFPRHISLVESEGGSALFVGSRPDPQAGFVMMRSFLDENPDAATAFLYAYIKGQRWCKDPDNWEEMRRIIVEDHGLDYPDNTWAAKEIETKIMTQDLGWDPKLMDEHLRFVYPFVDVTEDIPWRDYTDVTWLHQAQQALGLDPNPSADLSTGVTLVDNF